MSLDIADHLHFEIVVSQIVQCLFYLRILAGNADDHAAKGRGLDLVEIAEEHGALDVAGAYHPRNDGIVGGFPEEDQAKQQIAAGNRLVGDGIAAKGGGKVIGEKDADKLLRDGLLWIGEDLHRRSR